MGRRGNYAAPAGLRAGRAQLERAGEAAAAAAGRAQRRARPAKQALVERVQALCAELGWEMPEDRSHGSVTEVIDAALFERAARREMGL